MSTSESQTEIQSESSQMTAPQLATSQPATDLVKKKKEKKLNRKEIPVVPLPLEVPLQNTFGPLDMEAESTNQENVEQRKPQWSNKFQGIIAVLGYSVGLGNLLRFPYVCQKNRGGAFLIPYVISTAVLAIPLFILEVALGQFSAKGPIKIWSICPLMKGLGFCILTVSCIIVLYNSVVFSWGVYYIYSSFSNVLPWTTCGNPWNTPQCVVVGDTGVNSSVYMKPTNANDTTITASIGYATFNRSAQTSSVFGHTSTEEFWQNKALGVSSGIDDLGSIQPHLVICWFIACVAVFLCVMNGIKSLGKVWLEALMQVFFSVGPAWGTIIVMASHNSFHSNLIRDSIIVGVIGELTSVFAGFVVFATFGFLAHSLQQPVADVVTSGPGIGFIVYPGAVSLLPFPQLWSVLFFTTLLMIVVDSTLAHVETAVGCMEDLLPRRFHVKHLQTIMAAVFMGAVSLVGLVFTTHGGVYVVQLVDWYVGAVACFAIAVLECVAVGWCYGAERFSADVQMMIGKRLPVIYKVVCFIIVPALLTIVLVLTLASYKPPRYGEYDYPTSAIVFGWFIALVSVVPVPVFMVTQIHKMEGSLARRIKASVMPALEWLRLRRQHGLEDKQESISAKDNFLFMIGR
ncbi:sodium- and chloride-dependent glycine transporter 2-like [Haliotis rubra]|uniref:sodium- and chloride-dependent glycine transporter 2-like n=1 Tax=Haliotis rubra TaxID=36100 RepID=UPI001EE54BAE|nr:sodium- and chloride-dependent glycine transporter 2-like [Haliotis rubra]